MPELKFKVSISYNKEDVKLGKQVVKEEGKDFDTPYDAFDFVEDIALIDDVLEIHITRQE